MLGLSNGARSGLTGFVAGIARQSRIAGRNVTINNLLPGAFDTEPPAEDDAPPARRSPGNRSTTCAPSAWVRSRRSASARAAEFGAICALMCSAHAGYLTGQNILLDGGSYPGTF